MQVEFGTWGAIQENLAVSVIRVIIADDQPLFLKGISDFLNSERDISVVDTCTDGAQALDKISRLKPAVAILNIAMPNINGLEVLTAANRETLPTRILFLTAHANPREIIAAMAADAYGFLQKDSQPDELLRCVRSIATGQKCVPFELLTNFQDNTRQGDRIPIDTLLLTQREWKVMELAAKGLSNKEIARNLNVTAGTAKLHLYHIFKKVGVNNRTALATLAVKAMRTRGERLSTALIVP